MPLKRKFGRNGEGDCTKEPEAGYFAMLVDYEDGSPPALPKEPQRSPNDHRGTQPRKPPKYSPFAPCFQMFLYFYPIEVSQIPEETPKHPKK